MMIRFKATPRTVMVLFVVLAALAVPACAAETGISRNIPSTPHSGSEFDVVLTVSALEAGGIVETLPAGFTYAGTDFPEEQVCVSGQNVIFSVTNAAEIMYRVKAPPSGSGTFEGIWYDASNKTDGTIAETTVEVRYSDSGGGDDWGTGTQDTGQQRGESYTLACKAGESTNVTIDGPDILWIDLKVTKGSLDTSMNVNPSDLPAGTPAAPGDVCRYLNITGTDMSGADLSATISFRVKKSWIEENGLDGATVTLYRYHDGTWKALPTTPVGEDDEYLYFTAETSGFSIFAISGETRATSQVVAAASEQTTGAPTAVPTDVITVVAPTTTATTPAQSPPGIVGVIGALGVAAVGAGWKRGTIR